MLNRCYEFCEELCERDENILTTYIHSNRGTFALISLIGSVHSFECVQGHLSVKSTSDQRFDAIRKYLQVLLDFLKKLDDDQAGHLLGKLGSGAENIWLRSFQLAVNARLPAYNPPELQDWKERQNKELQNRGRELGTKIERHLKTFIIAQLKTLFGENWDIEIGAIQRECETRAKEQIEKNYKDGLGRQDIPWTDQFFISDYKTIIEKYWSRKPEREDAGFKTFEQHFSIDMDQGFHSKAEKLKWLSLFNSLRNLWAHEGTKDKGLNQHEVDSLKIIHDHFFS